MVGWRFGLLATGVRRDLGDLHVLELRQIHADGVVEEQFALLMEDHDADRHHRLRHARQREQRIGGHRRLGRRIDLADSLEVSELPTPGNRDDHARNASLFDLTLECRHNARKALGREADRGGICARERVLAIGMGSSGQRHHQRGRA